MNLHERLLSVLGCKFMNDVLIDAPVEITPDMIASLRITEVVHGTESDHNGHDSSFGAFSFDRLRSLSLRSRSLHRPTSGVSNSSLTPPLLQSLRRLEFSPLSPNR